jgi:GT2 family glycosyltransferase
VASSNVTTIVVNWKLKEQTCQCLSSLERLEHPCHTIVVDNGSGDGSASYIARHSPSAELLVLPSNIGFGAACNRAIIHALKDTSCEFVFLLNNDAVVHPHALSRLLSAAQDQPGAGILGPKILYWDRPNTIWYAGARRRWGILAAADTGRDRVDGGQFDTPRKVDYVFGAAMLIRRSVLERVGLFDERFFIYLEDLDLCLRTQTAGFCLLFVPQARVWHRVSSSTAHNIGLRKYHLAVSTACFLRKHISLSMWLPALGFWGLVLVRELAADLTHGDKAGMWSYWRGLIDGLAETARLETGWESPRHQIVNRGGPCEPT